MFSLYFAHLLMYGSTSQVQGLGSTNSEWGYGISDHSDTQLQRNV